MSRIAVLALTAVLAAAVALPVSAQSTMPRTEAAKRKVFTREPGKDRSGNDIKKAEMLATDGVDQCERMCRLMSACVAFTFVKRSTTVPKPICWLKDKVPVAYDSDCCTSGVLVK